MGSFYSDHRTWLHAVSASLKLLLLAVFVAIAFPGGFLFAVAFGQFTAKVAGGVVFSLLLDRLVLTRRRAVA